MTNFRRLAKGALSAAALFAATAAAGHEFWIEPLDYEVAVGEPIEATLKNGEDFKGSTYPYLDELFTRFELFTRDGAAPVAGRRGDNPAVNVKAATGGLHVFVYESRMYDLTYREFEKFENFLRSKKLDWALEAHAEKGFPTDRVKETYYRYPKALVKVGSGAGRDERTGQPFELVAEINPYSAAAKDGVRVRLYLEGAPFPGADVQIFHFPEGADEAAKAHATTDATGRATIPVFDGGPFLVNATHLRPPRPEGEAKGAHWESLWATMTYALPRRGE
ncbi:MAG: DUF4198 domain-containing protein [Pseudomonadota bacterium]